MPNPDRIRGIFVPNLVAYDSRGDVDESETRRYIDWLIDRGVHGLYPNGSTGEFVRLSSDERRQIAAMVVDQTRGRVPILAGAAEANTRDTLQACEYYASLGVRAVAIVAPFYYKLGPEAVYAYFAEIGRNSPVDVTLYNIPLFASPIDVPTVRRLAERFERITGIKDSSGDLPHMMRMIAAVRPIRPDFSFLTGWDAALMPMLLMGADGGTHAAAGVVPEIVCKLYETTRAGRIDEARALQYDLLKLFDAMILGVEFPEGFRVGVTLRGFKMGQGRQPLSETQAAELKPLRERLRQMLDDRGLLAASGGDQSSAMNPNDLAAIVRNVVGEMRSRGMI